MLNTALSGASTTCSIADLDPITAELDASFDRGTVAQFAQDHLDAPVPEPSTALLLTVGIAGLVFRRHRTRGDFMPRS